MPAEQRAFIDSNIVFYALGTETPKQKVACASSFSVSIDFSSSLE
jgi:predicted nucleic acid-binding protein